jgi:rhodanese-related sulfurtransferase
MLLLLPPLFGGKAEEFLADVSCDKQHLTQVDKYRYDDQWEIDAPSALHSFFDAHASPLCHASRPHICQLQLQRDAAIIDLRQPADFASFSFDGAINLPFVHANTPSPFSNSQVLDDLWVRLDRRFKAPDREVREKIGSKRLLVLCYDGDSARVATSVLQAHGYEARSIKGGYKQIEKELSDLNEALEQEIDAAGSGEAVASSMNVAAGRPSHPEMVRGISAAYSA